MDASVWLVTQGEYSNYRVLGVFSTKEKADAYGASHNAAQGSVFREDGTSNLYYGCEAMVEKYPLDAPAPTVPAAWVASFIWPDAFSDGKISVDAAAPDLLNGDAILRYPPGTTFLSFARPSREEAHRAAREMWRALKAGTFTLDAVPFTAED